LQESEFELVASLMAQALRRRDDEAAIGNVRDEVAALCRDFNPYASFTK
jgi:glycine/serine hydroxymethyltransferase